MVELQRAVNHLHEVLSSLPTTGDPHGKREARVVVTELTPEIVAVTERFELAMRHGFRQVQFSLFSSEQPPLSFWRTILAPMLPRADVGFIEGLDGDTGDSARVQAWIRYVLNQQWSRRHPETGVPALYTLDEVLLAMRHACSSRTHRAGAGFEEARCGVGALGAPALASTCVIAILTSWGWGAHFFRGLSLLCVQTRSIRIRAMPARTASVGLRGMRRTPFCATTSSADWSRRRWRACKRTGSGIPSCTPTRALHAQALTRAIPGDGSVAGVPRDVEPQVTRGASSPRPSRTR